MVLIEFGIFLLCCVEFFETQIQPLDSDNDYFYEGEALVQFANPSQEDVFREHQRFSVLCGMDAMKMVLPSGLDSEVTVVGSMGIFPLQEDLEVCGYLLTKKQQENVLHVSFSGCHVTTEEGRYTLKVLYNNNRDPAKVATVSCDTSCGLAASQSHRFRRSNQPFKCFKEPSALPSQSRMLSLNYNQGGCDIPPSQRLACGPSETTAAECLSNGCCMDTDNSTCYSPMDECTADGMFLFTIYANITTVPVSPESLVVGSKNGCKPIHANKEFAIFKFNVNECGTRSFNISETTIHMAEVITVIRTHNLKYGVITRDHPVRLMIECRYASVGPSMARASTGYMVKSPNMPSLVKSEGLFGIQLRIANDETFTSFSANHLPLSVLLGKPLYLEVRLDSPKPEATLLVHYCVAYPRSATSALVLLYEGCPNPHDSSVSVLYMGNLAQNKHQHRFEVRAFQFMNQTTNKYLNEEIYFMCSTEVCLPSDTPCRETCFDGKS